MESTQEEGSTKGLLMLSLQCKGRYGHLEVELVLVGRGASPRAHVLPDRPHQPIEVVAPKDGLLEVFFANIA